MHGFYRLQRFVISIITLCSCVLVLLCLPAYAQPASSTELIKDAKLYDGKIVVYTGEVIGELMRRGDYAWLNINDGRNAIGIWTPSSLMREIAFVGSYKSIGDTIEVTGVFHRACIQHGGDLDIHAQAIRKISAGRPVQHRLNIAKRNFTVILLGVLCLVWILILLKRK